MRRREIRFGLAREADDEIGGDADVRTHRAQLADLRFVFERGVAALHQRQNAVGAALHRQMQMIGKLRHIGIGVDQPLVELQRVRGGEADAADAVDLGEIADQQRQVGEPPPCIAPR